MAEKVRQPMKFYQQMAQLFGQMSGSKFHSDREVGEEVAEMMKLRGKTKKRKFGGLVKLAYDLGAEEAQVAPASVIVVENRIVWKCRYGCHMYGNKLCCPPYIPTPAEMRKFVSEYHYILLTQFLAHAKTDYDVMTSLERSSEEAKEKEAKKAHKFWQEWNVEKKKGHLIALTLEKAAFNIGFVCALCFTPGSCALCERCQVYGTAGEEITLRRCLHLTMLRLPEHGVGVNVRKTQRNAGMTLSEFPFVNNPDMSQRLLISVFLE